MVLMVYPAMIGFSFRELIRSREKKLVLVAFFVNFLLMPLVAYSLGPPFLFGSPRLFRECQGRDLNYRNKPYSVLTPDAPVPLFFLGKYVPADSVATLELIGIVVILPLVMGVLTFKCLLTRHTMDESNERIKPFLPGICA